MSASVDEPLLNDHRAYLVLGNRTGVRAASVPGFRAFNALASPFRLNQAFAGIESYERTSFSRLRTPRHRERKLFAPKW